MSRWQPPRLIAGTPAVTITPRQAEVLTGICHGLTNRVIGNRLGISEQSVKTHVARLFRAMNARDRAHAAALAISGQLTVVVHGYYEPERRAA